MASTLADKIRNARRLRIEAGGHTFVALRPTDLDMVEFNATGTRHPRHLLKHVIGWEGVREMDLVPSGDPHPAPFEPEALDEWLKDRLDILAELSSKLIAAYGEHQQAKEEAAKNS